MNGIQTHNSEQNAFSVSNRTVSISYCVQLNRVQYIVSNCNVSKWRPLLSDPFISRKSTPQGSILSPLLFNLYLKKMGDVLTPNTKILQYADDIVLFSMLENFSIALDSVQLSLNQIDLPGSIWNLSLEISPTKTQMIIFSKKASQILPPFYFIS